MDLRTLALGLGVFCATFMVGWWLNIGGLASGFAKPAAQPTVQSVAPGESALQRVAVVAPAVKTPPPKAPRGKGLIDDQLTRDAVVAWARNYRRPPCNQDVRWGYVRSTTKYAEALMRSAGCNNFPRCPMSAGQLDRVWQANRSALDLPVAEAMAAANAAGGLSDKSYRGDVGRAVRVIAGRDFDPGPPPACSSKRNRSWKVRFRGRR